MPSSKIRKPRALTPPIGVPERQPFYKASMHLERQKFMKRETVSQLYFKETGQKADQTTIQAYGLDLDVGQARALAAVQELLHDTEFQGHDTFHPPYSERFKGAFSLPVLRVTPSEFYNAYGLEKTTIAGKEAYPGRQREEALKDLLSLNTPRRIVYERKRFSGRKSYSDIVLAPDGKLVDVQLAYESLEEEEAEAVKAGRAGSKRLSSICITCGIPFIDQVDRFYVLKKRDLFRQIAALYPGKRQPRGVSLLVEYLWTLDTTPFEIGQENLACYAGLGSLIERRHRREALKALRVYLEQVKALGYLLDFSLSPLGNYLLYLNPEECSRVRSKQKRLDAYADRAEGKSRGKAKR